MKFVSFRIGDEARYGVLSGNGIVDLSVRLKYPDLKSLIAGGGHGDAADAVLGAKPDIDLGEIAFEPVIPNPEKIICVGLNYHEHRQETGMTQHRFPAIFPRWADTQCGHLAPIVLPKNAVELDWEGELAVVVSKGGRHIAEADAMNHVFGYACYNDASLRDFQKHSSQFTPGKNFPATGAFGPYLATADEMGSLEGKKIQTRLNGEIMQSATLDMMIFGVPWLIAYLSSFTPLSPGDVVEVEIDGCGILKNTIAAEPQ